MFEGGILEKMTNAEYEKMFKLSENIKNDENSNIQNNAQKKHTEAQLVIISQN